MQGSKRNRLGVSWWGLTPQLFVILILPVTFLLLAVTLGSVQMHQQAMRQLVGDRDERAVRAAAAALQEQIFHRQSAIQSLSLQAKTGELSQILEVSSFLSDDFDHGIAFIASDKILVSAGEVGFWEQINKDVFSTISQESRSTDTPVVTVAEDNQGQKVIVIGSETQVPGVMAVGAVSAKGAVHETLAGLLSTDQSGSAFIVSQADGLIYQVGGGLEVRDPMQHAGVTQALAGQNGATYQKAGWDEHVIAFSPVTPLGWGLVIEEPWNTVSNPMLRMTESAPLILIPAFLLAVSILWFATRQIVEPLQALEARARKLAWGDFSSVSEPVGGIGEIQSLQAEMAAMASKVQNAQRGLHNYIDAITQGQEEERMRLARELHDDTLQALIALNQRLQLAQMRSGANPSLDSLNEIQALTQTTIENLRRSIRALRPIYLEDLGLAAALEMLARETEQSSDLQIRFTRLGTERRLSPATELTLYRIAQEALSNIVRHAKASQADVQFTFDEDAILLEIRDNGVGFEVPESPTAFAPNGHFGLLGLHERAEILGAQLEIQSILGKGTQVSIFIAQ